MRRSHQPGRSRFGSVAISVVVLLTILARAGSAESPWEIWDDLHRLAELPTSGQVLLRSSHCLSGCPFDRHSSGDGRYLRVENGEGVIFDEPGAGAIVRIWMTMGAGGESVPLSSDVRMRIYLDGASEPTVDLPLPSYFDGSAAPFLPPMVGDRTVSSGGNFSYVPIPYRDGCKVTLVGADDQRIWYQLTFHRLAEPDGVTTFTGEEDLSAWAALLSQAGADPWPPPSPDQAVNTTGNATLEPGATVTLAEVSEPGIFTALQLVAPPSSWPELELTLSFDGTVTSSLPLADFFAVGRGGVTSTRSLLVGVDADDALYAYFPMPFFAAAEVSLTSRAAVGSPVVPVSWQVRREQRSPSPASGLFGATLNVDDETSIGLDIPLLELAGRGRWVGLFVDLGSVGTASRQYLEGDERVFLDGSRHPGHYGTGTEDLFNGGFYFDQGSFSLALHGSPYHLTPGGEDATAAYRLLLTDAVPFATSIRAGLEGGPESNLALRVRTVAYHYSRPEPGLWLWDVLDLGDSMSRSDHAWTVDGYWALLPLDDHFEGEPPVPFQATGSYRPPGTGSFRLTVPSAASRLRIRRLLDAGAAGQEAEIFVGGQRLAAFPAVPENFDRRWQEVDVELTSVAIPATRKLDITVVALTSPAVSPPEDTLFSEFRYELWADVDPSVFADGFESGDLSRWSTSVP